MEKMADGAGATIVCMSCRNHVAADAGDYCMAGPMLMKIAPVVATGSKKRACPNYERIGYGKA